MRNRTGAVGTSSKIKSEGRNKPVRKPHSKNQLQGKETKQQMTQAESALTFDNIAEPDR